MCAWAAMGGHLEVLKWLHRKGCPWDQAACARAAQGGHLEVLKWLLAHDCPWDGRTYWGAELEVVEWLRASGLAAA